MAPGWREKHRISLIHDKPQQQPGLGRLTPGLHLDLPSYRMGGAESCWHGLASAGLGSSTGQACLLLGQLEQRSGRDRAPLVASKWL